MMAMDTTDRYELALAALERAATRLPRDPDDRFVRFGRCQWSARKRRPVDRYCTLYTWLAEMKAKAPEAWAVVNAAGVRIDGRSVRFKGKAAKGDRLVDVLGLLLRASAVAAYEVESTRQALQRLEGKTLQPGRWSRRLVGCGLTVANESAELRRGRIRIRLDRPETSTTVGALCGPKELALVAESALAAPDQLVAALWSLTHGSKSTRPRAKQALAAIAERIRADAKPHQDAPHTAAELLAMGLDAEVDVIQRLVWPAPPAAVDFAALPERLESLERMRRSPLRPRTGWALAE